MITCKIADTKEIDVYLNNGSVEIYFTFEGDSISALNMSRHGAELLLTRLMESLNKIKKKV